MPESLVPLMSSAAVGAWLTKVLVDLIRLRWTSLDGKAVLLLAGVLSLALNFGWTVYQREPLVDASDYMRVVFQSILSLLGSVATTELQTAAKKASKEGEEWVR